MMKMFMVMMVVMLAMSGAKAQDTTAAPTTMVTTAAPTTSAPTTATPTTSAPATATPFSCGLKPQSDCANTPGCTALFGVPQTDPSANVTYLGCGLATSCNNTVPTPSSKCVIRANVPGGAIYTVVNSCNVFLGLLDVPCPPAAAPDNRKHSDEPVMFDGCARGKLHMWSFPPGIPQQHKVVYMLDLELLEQSDSNATAMAVTSLNVTFAVPAGVSQITPVTFSNFDNTTLSGFAELFGALPPKQRRYFGLVTYATIDHDIDVNVNCTKAPAANVRAREEVPLVMTVNADTDFFNVTKFGETVATLVGANSTAVRATNTWLTVRVVDTATVTVTFVGPQAGEYASRFLYLFYSEDPQLAANGLTITSVTVPPAPAPASDDDGGLSRGAIIGITIACIVGAVLIVAVIVVVIKSREPSVDEAKTQMLY